MSERRDISDLQSEMQRVRGELGRDVDELIESTRDAMNWHYYVRRYPWACVGAAVVLGFLLAPKTGRTIVRIHPPLPSDVPVPQPRQKSGGVSGMLKSAALSGAARLAGGLATQLASRLIEQSRGVDQGDLSRPHDGD